jgi:DNA-binding NtrC family response regulator
VAKANILIVDDERDMRTGLQRVLQRRLPDVSVTAYGNGLEAIASLQDQSYSLALLDIKMEGMNGLELLAELRMCDPWMTVIMMTGFGTIEMAVEAMRTGAYDFISKPFDNETLHRVVQKGLERNQLIRENHYLRERVKNGDHTSGFVGSSTQMKDFLYNLETVAKSNYTTLVRGQSGTGKELTARAIHQLSNRRDKSLIMVNCPAIPENLLESELFGHTKGAFTDATQPKKGLFAEADGGTICLDEVGDLPLSTQSKLLRVLQEREIRPLGSGKDQKIDVRVVALTNLDLEQMIKDKLFREDLYYRLNVVTLKTPSLQDLREDIPELIHHFTLEVCKELEIPPKTFCQRAVSTLVEREWPGNVRELQNVVRRVVMFSDGQIIQLDDLNFVENPLVSGKQNTAFDSFAGQTDMIYKEAKRHIVDSFTTHYIISLLQKTGGNVTRSAELSGLSRAALQKIMKRLDVRASEYRESSQYE